MFIATTTKKVRGNRAYSPGEFLNKIVYLKCILIKCYGKYSLKISFVTATTKKNYVFVRCTGLGGNFEKYDAIWCILKYILVKF